MKLFEKYLIVGLVLLTVLLHLIAYHVWFFSSGVLTQGDWILSLPNWSKSLLYFPTIWKSYAIGAVDFTPPFYMFLLLEGFLSNLGVPYAYIERITFMWPIALFTIPFSFIFLKNLVKNNIAALVGALVYTYNTYFLIIQTGHLTLMIGFTFAPLALFFFRKTLENKSFYYGVITGIIGFIISYYEFRAFYLLAILAATYYFYFVFFISEEKAFKAFFSTLLQAFTPILVVLILNFYWILPLLKVTPISDGSIFNRELFGKEFMNINKATTLFHPYWNGSKYLPFITQPIQLQFFLIPIIAFLGMYFSRKNKQILFYGLIALVGIFLTKQNNVPFPDVYYWLYLHVPGFNAFREASKFYFYIALSYSVLIAAFIAWTWEKWKTKNLYMLRYVVVVILALMCFINIRPLMFNEFDTLFQTRTMPYQYIGLNNFIDSQNDYFRTLWVPVDARWGTNTNVHPKVGEANIVTATWKKFTNASAYPTLGHQFIDLFDYPEMPQLLNMTSIKYVIVPLEDKSNDDDFFQLFFKSRKDYIDQLDHTSYLSKVNSNIKNITIYENKTYRPHIYRTEVKETLLQQNTFTKIVYSTIDTTHYVIHLKNINKPFYLNFSDSYHPDWKIRLGDFNWYDAIKDKNYFISSSYHFKNADNLNTFYIDPKIFTTSQSNKIIKNADGSFDAEIHLYFQPQSYMYLGSIISGSFAGLLVLYLVIFGIKSYARKNR